MQVRDVMTHTVPNLTPETSLGEAAASLKALGLALLPVIEQERVAGLVTSQSVEQAAERAGLGAAVSPLRPAIQPARTCRADASTEEAARTLQQSGGPGLIVLDQQGRVLGVVTANELEGKTSVRPGAEAGAAVAAQEVPFASFSGDPVDHMSEESFPASDPPPPPTATGNGPAGKS